MDWPLKAVKSKATKIKGGVDKNMFRTAGKKTQFCVHASAHTFWQREPVCFSLYALKFAL